MHSVLVRTSKTRCFTVAIFKVYCLYNILEKSKSFAIKFSIFLCVLIQLWHFQNFHHYSTAIFSTRFRFSHHVSVGKLYYLFYWIYWYTIDEYGALYVFFSMCVCHFFFIPESMVQQQSSSSVHALHALSIFRGKKNLNCDQCSERDTYWTRLKNLHYMSSMWRKEHKWR